LALTLGPTGTRPARWWPPGSADGGYVQVVRGQIPAEKMDECMEGGAPRSFATWCIANYGFVVSGLEVDWVFGESLRRFTRTGR
jgi:hypothetical protein